MTIPPQLPNTHIRILYLGGANNCSCNVLMWITVGVNRTTTESGFRQNSSLLPVLRACLNIWNLSTHTIAIHIKTQFTNSTFTPLSHPLLLSCHWYPAWKEAARDPSNIMASCEVNNRKNRATLCRHTHFDKSPRSQVPCETLPPSKKGTLEPAYWVASDSQLATRETSFA